MNTLLKSARLGGPPTGEPQLPGGRDACGMTASSGRIQAGGTSMAALARMLSGSVGRIVIDRTGLAGRGFNIDLEYTPDPASAPGPPPAAATNNPAIFTALEEQLGLKLQPERAPIDVLVIDRVEPPTEN